MIDDFRAEAVRLALKKMFNGGYFDICTVDSCLKTAKIVPPTDDHQALRTLHCVRWSEMSPAMREQVAERVFELFGHPEWRPQETEESALASGSPGLFRRLIGKGADA